MSEDEDDDDDGDEKKESVVNSEAATVEAKKPHRPWEKVEITRSLVQRGIHPSCIRWIKLDLDLCRMREKI